MISYKVLIILTVIFDIICCNGPVDECIEISAKVGFRSSDTGFYNYNFVKQFPDYTEFIKHVKTRLNISSDDNVNFTKEIGHADATLGTQDDSTSMNRKQRKTDNNATLPEKIRYLHTFYFNIRKSNSHALFVNPYQYCTMGVRKKFSAKFPLRSTQDMRNRFLAFITKKSVPIDERDLFLQRLEESIKLCEKQIMNYQLKTGNKIFKYDQYNAHKNFLISYEMALLKDPNQGTIGSLDLNFGSGVNDSANVDFGIIFTGGYFRYVMSIFGELFDTMEMFTTPQLCKSYFSKMNEDD